MKNINLHIHFVCVSCLFLQQSMWKIRMHKNVNAWGEKALDFPEVLEVERNEPVLTSSSQVSLRVRQPLGTAVSLLENGGYQLYLVKSENQWGSL